MYCWGVTMAVPAARALTRQSGNWNFILCNPNGIIRKCRISFQCRCCSELAFNGVSPLIITWAVLNISIQPSHLLMDWFKCTPSGSPLLTLLSRAFNGWRQPKRAWRVPLESGPSPSHGHRHGHGRWSLWPATSYPGSDIKVELLRGAIGSAF